jgi:hypothetical protein
MARRLRAWAIAAVVGAAFWGPAWPAARGYFPAPLDDVYIHFDFARSLATGHPFEWIAGQGYSSGETSPLYAAVLAIGWAIGFRGPAIGLWAALVAIVSVASLLLSIERLVRPAPSWLTVIAATLPLTVGLLDWSLFSGMEIALFAAAMGRALVSLERARGRGSTTREKRQWMLGAWGIALVLLRPEAVVVVAVLALVAARGAGARSGVAAVVRVALPGAIATLAVLAMHKIGTGDARAAGAQLKLLSSNPYFSEVDRARVFVENLVTFFVKARIELAFPLVVLVLIGAIRKPIIGGCCLASALAWTLLVSWNVNAPHHNLRYYAPAVLFVLVSAAAGLAVLARVSRALALGAFVLVALMGLPRGIAQAKHFRAATANIRDQQIEVGERLAKMDARIVLLGDAGAIPFVSRARAVDALGLGGYHSVPFAHAAVHGEAATIELLERLPPSERPTHLALYPSWFAATTSRFGTEIDRVTISGNVICGSPTKAIYRADWSALDTGPRASEIDVADVLSEEAHGYVGPMPRGGWTTLDILADEAGSVRFDAGRIIPEGASESFVLPRTPVRLRIRVDANAKGIELTSSSGIVRFDLEPPVAGRWRSGSVVLDGGANERVTLTAREGAYVDYHLWLD